MHELVAAVRDGLEAAGDPAAAGPMQAYMRSAMPFRGVPKPARTELLRTLLREHPLSGGADELREVAGELWDGAAYREERYLALGIVDRHARWVGPEWVEGVFRGWIITGAWWDFTDEIANRRVGPLLRAHRGALTPVLRGWITEPDRWLRRTSIICQLGARADVDLDLLREAIEANQHDPDFFLRKGIGWALRQHARVDPDWVRRFVAEHPDLSPLSRREALKHLGA